MADYIQIQFENISADQSAILIAELSEAGFEGFEENDNELKAFIAINNFNKSIVDKIAEELSVKFSSSTIKETNWNEVWESNFKPVVVEDFVAVRADFHDPIGDVMHEIVITPKMSFGTGHHATTWMMMREMKEIDFTGKTVFDFGTGTGILAILAEKLGAAQVLAIDNDDWSIANGRENILQNKTGRIEIRKGDSADVGKQFDIILANINKNVIMDNFGNLAKHLGEGGILVISGLLITDEGDILAGAQRVGLRSQGRRERDNWLCLNLSR